MWRSEIWTETERTTLRSRAQASSLISVHRNTSTLGTIDANSFATKVTFATGTTTFDVAIADIDGDGKKDLISGNSGGDSVSILRNTATAGEITASSFAAKQDFSGWGPAPARWAIGDIDGDGKLDIATGNQTDNTLSVLYETPAPSVPLVSQVRSPLQRGRSPSALQ